jgi:uncharacterized protein YaaW (UPF0174 family)
MQSILAKAELADFEFLLGILTGRWNFIQDEALKNALQEFRRDPSDDNRKNLADRIEHETRYAGSAELAYWIRVLLGREPGVQFDDVIQDVSKKLGVKNRALGTPTGRLQRLVRGLVQKSFLGLTPDEQRQLLQSQGVGLNQIQQLLDKLKAGGKVALLPLLYSVLGGQLTQKLILGLGIEFISIVIGKQAAMKLIGQIVARFPWWGECLGPIVCTGSVVWLAIDLQGPAYRITVPTLVYLGLISLRNGPEGGDSFFQEPDEE